MNTIDLDSKQCIGCGQCLQVCPRDCFSMEHGALVIAVQKCFGCGHCLAVCPVDAIAIDGLAEPLSFVTFTELPGVTVAQQGDLASLVRLMRSRRSVRHYEAKPVALDLLQDLVKIGTTAPSGTNSQGWSFVILERRVDVVALGDGVAQFFKKLNQKAASPLLRTLARVFAGDRLGRYYRRHYKSVEQGLGGWFDRGEDLLFHGATAVILVGGAKSASCPAEDALLASGQILLAAQQMGLGTCLIGFAVEALKHDAQLRERVGVAPNEDIYAVIGLGYAAEQYLKPAPRKNIEGRVVRLAE